MCVPGACLTLWDVSNVNHFVVINASESESAGSVVHGIHTSSLVISEGSDVFIQTELF
jgi:hypothetical protein